MSHWYDAAGILHEFVPYKDPKRTGFRDANLSDAREHGWFPSVTTVLQLLAKPGLVRWQVEQGIKAAWQVAAGGLLPNNLTLEEAVSQTYYKSEEYRDYAANFGTAVHFYVNRTLAGRNILEIPPMFPGAEEVADGLIQWFSEQSFEWKYTEKHFANSQLGVAGSMDLAGFRTQAQFPAMGDIKTQEEPLTPHSPEYPLQLSGYCLGMGLPIETERWSFIANRTKPGEVKGYLWQDKDSTVEETNRRYDAMFMQLLELWFMLNRYDPRC